MPGPVHGELVGDALVLHTTVDAWDAVLHELAGLPPAPRLCTVVTAPSVTGRPDLGEVLPAMILAYLFDARDGIRWLPVGRFVGDPPRLDVLGLDVVMVEPEAESPVSPEVVALLTAVCTTIGTRPATGTPEPAPAPPITVAASEAQHPVTRWVAVRAALDGDDPGALRTVLAGRYDAHARLVARTLAEQPGLRAGVNAAALVPGLVALRAYVTGDRLPVNMYLRTAQGDDAPSRELLARCAAYGLHRLPVAIGPVFAVHAARAPDGFRPGDELTEPSFVDAGLAPGRLDGRAGVEYAIWSVSARRLGGLGTTAGAALFPPGARFSVLAVDPPDDAGQPARVLLRELTVAGADHSNGADPPDRMLSRLRAAARTGADPVTLDFPLGLDATGRRYAATPATRPATADPVRSTLQEGGTA